MLLVFTRAVILNCSRQPSTLTSFRLQEPVKSLQVISETAYIRTSTRASNIATSCRRIKVKNYYNNEIIIIINLKVKHSGPKTHERDTDP